MLSKIRLLPLLVLAIAALLLAACGGSSNNASDDDTDPPAAPTEATDDTGDDVDDVDMSDPAAIIASGGDVPDDLFVSNGFEVLSASGDAYTPGDVTSGAGSFTFTFAMGQVETTGEASYAFQAPDQMHMAMSFEGGDSQSLVDLSEIGTFEILVRDGSVFMNIPFLGGWFAMSPEELGADPQALQDLMGQGSLVDWAGFTSALPELVTYVGEEDIGGVATVHYQLNATLNQLIAAFADALSTTGEGGVGEQILTSELAGDITVDVWVGKANLLPYKMEAATSFDTPEGPFVLSLSGTFGSYNEAVDIPAAPDNPQNFADLFGELLGGGATP